MLLVLEKPRGRLSDMGMGIGTGIGTSTGIGTGTGIRVGVVRGRGSNNSVET